MVLVHIYNYTEDIYNNFDLVYNHIINDFEGDERAYLMSAMIGLLLPRIVHHIVNSC